MSHRILWVKSGSLYPLDTGGKKRSHAMLCELSRSHDVTYLGMCPGGVSGVSPEEESAPYADRKIWVSPEARAQGGGFSLAVELAKNFLGSSLPFALARYRNRELEAYLRELCRPDQFDLVVCDFLTPAPAFLTFGEPGCPIPSVLFQHNMEAQIWKRLAEGKKNPVARFYFGSQSKRMARWEERLSRLFDGVITVSPEDSSHARGIYGLKNVLGDVPTGVSTEDFASVTRGGDGKTAGFLGSMDWMPNIEAVRWFADAILPKIRDVIPDFQLMVIGRNPSASVVRLGHTVPGIHVTGTVDDIRPDLSKCDLLVVPLLSGGGTRIKIMESLAAGVPVVSTAVGAEGLGLTHGEEIVIADSEAKFAQSVCDLMGDSEKRERISATGKAFVRTGHGWDAVTERFLDLCEAILTR